MPTLSGRTKEEWHEHIDILFSVAHPDEDIPLDALRFAWKGTATDEDIEWARTVIRLAR